MKKISLVIVAILFSTMTFAQAEMGQEFFGAPPMKKCKGLKLDPSQMNEVRTKMIEMRKYQNLTMPKMKNAMMDYHAVMTATSSTVQEADTAHAVVEGIMSGMMAMKTNTEHSILFDIFTDDQRVKAVKCKMRMRRRGPKPPRGRHPKPPRM